MNRISTVLALFLFFCHYGLSQKRVEKELVNLETTSIEINTINCFLLTLKTHASKRLKVEATMEGEYAKDLGITLEEEGSNIFISTSFLPNFSFPNDKLSAHKVISVSMAITLPQNMQVNIYGKHSTVIASGDYNTFSVALTDGDCTLADISGKITVKTQKGEISVSDAKGIVEAKSDYGKVLQGMVLNGQPYFSLHSVEGNILVNSN